MNDLVLESGRVLKCFDLCLLLENRLLLFAWIAQIKTHCTVLTVNTHKS